MNVFLFIHIYFLLAASSMVEKSWFAINTSSCLNCFPKQPVFVLMVVCNFCYLRKHQYYQRWGMAEYDKQRELKRAICSAANWTSSE